MPLSEELVDMLVCPKTKEKLIYQRDLKELWSVTAKLAYPIRDDIPVMIESEARQLDESEINSLR